MFAGNIFFLIKMPLESVEISRVNVDGDNINLTAAVVDSFDVAVVRERRRKIWKKIEQDGKTENVRRDINYVYKFYIVAIHIIL
jgi:hypothetical protein